MVPNPILVHPPGPGLVFSDITPKKKRRKIRHTRQATCSMYHATWVWLKQVTMPGPDHVIVWLFCCYISKMMLWAPKFGHGRCGSSLAPDFVGGCHWIKDTCTSKHRFLLIDSNLSGFRSSKMPRFQTLHPSNWQVHAFNYPTPPPTPPLLQFGYWYSFGG